MSVFGSSLHTLSISRGTYDIETIITMLNVSDVLFEIVYSGENVFRVYNQFVIPTLTQLIHSLNKAIHLSRCVRNMNEIKELWKPAKRRGATRMMISGFKRNIYFIDLIDFYSKQHKSIQEVLGRQKSTEFYMNRGYKYVLVCIDGYSKYLMTRKLKSKSDTEVTHAMKDIIQTYGESPKHSCSDRGTEFTNAIFRTNILNKYDINMYHMDSANKAVLAERTIRDIKEHIMVPSFHSINGKVYGLI